MHAGYRAQVARLRHWTVRQEPSRRSEQVLADGPRLRRILRLFISPRRNVRSVLVLVPGRPEFLQSVWAAQPGALLRDRYRRRDSDAALGQGRQAKDRR